MFMDSLHLFEDCPLCATVLHFACVMFMFSVHVTAGQIRQTPFASFHRVLYIYSIIRQVTFACQPCVQELYSCRTRPSCRIARRSRSRCVGVPICYRCGHMFAGWWLRCLGMLSYCLRLVRADLRNNRTFSLPGWPDRVISTRNPSSTFYSWSKCFV